MAWGLGPACAAGAAAGSLLAASRPWIPDSLPCLHVHIGIEGSERALKKRPLRFRKSPVKETFKVQKEPFKRDLQKSTTKESDKRDL